MSTKNSEHTPCSVKVTNYFSGGDRRREEMLAQPEDDGSCTSCPSCKDTDCDIGCSVEGTPFYQVQGNVRDGASDKARDSSG